MRRWVTDTSACTGGGAPPLPDLGYEQVPSSQSALPNRKLTLRAGARALVRRSLTEPGIQTWAAELIGSVPLTARHRSCNAALFEPAPPPANLAHDAGTPSTSVQPVTLRHTRPHHRLHHARTPAPPQPPTSSSNPHGMLHRPRGYRALHPHHHPAHRR